MKHRTKLTIRHIRTYNAFLQNCAKHAKSEEFARLYERSKIIRAKIGQTVLKG